MRIDPVFIKDPITPIAAINQFQATEIEEFLANKSLRTKLLLESLASACHSRSMLKNVMLRLSCEGIVEISEDFDDTLRTLLSDDDEELQETESSSAETDPEDLDDDDVPDVDSLLQMEVFNSSAVKNIGRFNCEFLRYEKLGQVFHIHLSIQINTPLPKLYLS